MRRIAPATQIVGVLIVAAFVAQHVIAALWFAQSPLQILALGSSPEVLLKAGAAYSGMELSTEWWRVLTSMFLHAGFVHLLANGIALMQIGRLLEGLFGTRKFLVSYTLGGIIAALATVAIPTSGEPSVYIGASGAIFSIAGTLVVGLRRIWRAEAARWSQRLASRLTGCIGANIVLGVVISAVATYFGSSVLIANTAHIAGLLTGVAIGLFPLHMRHNPYTHAVIRTFEPPPPPTPEPPLDPFEG